MTASYIGTRKKNQTKIDKKQKKKIRNQNNWGGQLILTVLDPAGH